MYNSLLYLSFFTSIREAIPRVESFVPMDGTMLGKQILIIEVSQICQTYNFPGFVLKLNMTELRTGDANREILLTFFSP